MKKKISIKDKVNLKRLKIDEYNNFKKFLIKNYYKNHILAKNKNLFDWFYKSNKFYNFIIALKNKSIIGVIGYIPLKKFDKKLKKNHYFFSIASVLKSKVPGIFLKLILKVRSFNTSDFVGVVGINQELLNFHRWIGYKVFLMNHHFFQNKNFKIKILKKKYKRTIIAKTLNIIKINKNNLSLIDKNIFKKQTPQKSNTYLLNRYIKNPFYKYNIYLLKKSNIKILVISRILKVKKVSILKIIDCIYNREDFKYIGTSLQKILEETKCEYADMYSYGISKKLCQKSGFLNRYQGKEIIPEYFEPFVNKNIDIYGAYISKNKNIRLFKGDGDMDRPSIL